MALSRVILNYLVEMILKINFLIKSVNSQVVNEFFSLKCVLFLVSEIRRAETATQRVHRWRIVERPLDIEVSCEFPDK